MNLRFINWQNGEAVKISSGHCELIIATSIGPRIVSLKDGNGFNLLYEDTTGFGVGDWKLYGGHRFTLAPENATSYYPDNVPCAVNTVGETVIVSAPIRADGLRLSIKVSADSTNCGFEIVHILENYGSTNWNGALWAITCLPRSAQITATCTTNKICYWPGTERGNWYVAEGLMHVRAGSFRGKVGWHEPNGLLAARQVDALLTISSPEETVAEECVDNGCNLEIFACANWIELETLGKRVDLSPGGCVQHVQHWILSSHV
jgi:hypothetical protein